MKVLIVHAHHEPQSFSSSLAKRAQEKLLSLGHEVTFSDLYALKFDPVSDRRNFTTTKDTDYLKQQAEEVHATKNDGFAPDVEAEMQKLEAADAVIFSFPLWWFGMPAILKGWADRVLAAGRITEFGFNALSMSGVRNCWARDLRIQNPDSGIFINGRNVTVDGLVIESERKPEPTRQATGHHGAILGGQDNLLTNFDYRTRFMHEITVSLGAAGNVAADGRGVDRITCRQI